MSKATITLTEATFNQLTAYLGNRPYVEVAGLVELLRKELSGAAAANASTAASEAHQAISNGNGTAATVTEETRDLSASA
jgi:hypothetical protein